MKPGSRSKSDFHECYGLMFTFLHACVIIGLKEQLIINITILFLNATRWFEMGGVGGGKFKGEQKCKFGFMYVLIIMLSL